MPKIADHLTLPQSVNYRICLKLAKNEIEYRVVAALRMPLKYELGFWLISCFPTLHKAVHADSSWLKLPIFIIEKCANHEPTTRKGNEEEKRRTKNSVSSFEMIEWMHLKVVAVVTTDLDTWRRYARVAHASRSSTVS